MSLSFTSSVFIRVTSLFVNRCCTTACSSFKYYAHDIDIFSPAENGDFSLNETRLTIPVGDIPSPGNVCVNVTALDDTILEGSEEFSISIAGTDIAEVTVGVPSSSMVTIIDADGVC